MALPASVGIAYRLELASWIASRPPEVELLEITAEHFYRVGDTPLRRLAEWYPLVVHTSRLSLGTPGPLDGGELEAFGRVVAAADPLWVSERLGFRRIDELDLGGPNPVALTSETLARFIEHGREVMARCGKRLLLGNIASPLLIAGTLAEPDFLNRFCAETGAGILLDLTSLVVGGRNHRFEPRVWLRAIEPGAVGEVQVGGCACEDGRWIARHDGPVDDEAWDLLDEARSIAPGAARILVRDANFPPPSDLAAELRRLADPRAPAATTEPLGGAPPARP
jgi:uncharacterized protein (UPF0276 family)